MWNVKLRNRQAAFNVAILVVAACLAAAPWLLGYVGERAAAVNAWSCAVLLALVAVAALARAREWQEWTLAVIGAWTALSPWLLGYASASARWTQAIAGAIALVLALGEMWTERRERPAKTA
jgi:hypothetical protein